MTNLLNLALTLPCTYKMLASISWQGYNIRTVADRLGHENIQTTLNIYGHLYNDVDAKIANELNHLIK